MVKSKNVYFQVKIEDQNGQDLESYQLKKLTPLMLSVYLNYLYLQLNFIQLLNQEDHYLVFNTVILLIPKQDIQEMLKILVKVLQIQWLDKLLEVLMYLEVV